MDSSQGLPSTTDPPVPSAPSQPVDTSASVAATVVHNLIASSGRTAVSGDVGWPPGPSSFGASPGISSAPPTESYVPTMHQPQKRVLPVHLGNPVPRSSHIPGWSQTHTFIQDDVPVALQKLFVMAEAHADHISNLQIEAGMMNTSVNMVSVHAFHNVNLMVNQLKDETSRQFLRQQTELNAKTPAQTPFNFRQTMSTTCLFCVRTCPRTTMSFRSS